MALQRKYRINLKNYGNPPSIQLSQYDENYELVFEVRDGLLPSASLSGYTVTLKGFVENSNFELVGAVDETLNNLLIFTVNTTMTGKAGKGKAEIVFTDSNNIKFATFNMLVFVEKAPITDTNDDSDETSDEVDVGVADSMVLNS